MRVPAAVIAVVGAVLALSGCGSAAHTKTVTKPFVSLPVRALQVARASDERFSIFPAKPGKKFCVIPGGGMRTTPLRGTCQTRVYASHLLQGPRFIVAFTERWGFRCRKGDDCVIQRTWHHTWSLSTSGVGVAARDESGVQDPATWK